jgi:cobalt-precorrin-5B (C1)-methyltransferase
VSALREGYTTGSSAAAAAKAALLLLDKGVAEKYVEIPLPDGRRIKIPVTSARVTGGGAEATVVKDAGDDPDVTNGALIVVSIAWTEGNGVEFAAGEGVGTVTKPGLALPPGEPAINPIPRLMITAALREVTSRGVRVTIAIPGGMELAKKTFNPRIGVAGGLSILGTTGIVRPFSGSAMRESLRCAFSVCAAGGIRLPVLVPGHIGERAARAHLRLSDEQLLAIGNEWGFALDEFARHPFTGILAVGHPGKLAKLTVGDWDTHSGRSGSALPIVESMHKKVLGRKAEAVPTVEGIFAALAAEEKKRVADALATAVQEAIMERTAGRLEVSVLLIDLGGSILGEAGELTPWR